MMIRILFACLLSLGLSTFAFAQEKNPQGEHHQSNKTFFKMMLPSPGFLLKFEADLSLSSKQVEQLEKLQESARELKQKKKTQIKSALENVEKQLKDADASEDKIQRAIKSWQDSRTDLRTEILYIHAKARNVLNEEQRQQWVKVGSQKSKLKVEKPGKAAKAKKTKDDDDEDDDE
jgi:Spy/CpxP family protein refolding chaperone